MHTSPILLTIWLVLLLAFVGVMIYRATLTQHETDQLFLTDTTTLTHQHSEHDVLMAKLKRIGPAAYGLGVATAVATLVLIGQTLWSGAGF